MRCFGDTAASASASASASVLAMSSPSWLARAPSPPPQLNSSSLEYIEARLGDEEVEVTRTTQYVAVDRHGRPTTVTPPADDYEW